MISSSVDYSEGSGDHYILIVVLEGLSGYDGSWQFIAPRTISEAVEVGAPMFFKSPLSARSALLSITSIDRQSSENADLTLVLALIATGGCIIDLSVAFLAIS